MREVFAKQKEKRAILIAAGSFYGLPFSVTESDLVIAIDGGISVRRKTGFYGSEERNKNIFQRI